MNTFHRAHREKTCHRESEPASAGENRGLIKTARSLVDEFLRSTKRDFVVAVNKATIRKYMPDMYHRLLKQQEILVRLLANGWFQKPGDDDFAGVFLKSRRRLVRSFLTAAYRDRKGAVIRVQKADDEFEDVITDASEAWATEEAGAKIVGISRAVEAKIRNVIAQAVKEGWSIPRIQRAIKPMIDLDESRIARLEAYEAELIDRGITGAKFDRMYDREESRLSRDRAETIARTETAAATSEGTLTAFDGMDIVEVEWIADPEACDECEANNGKIFTVADAHGLIPAHPNCECTWGAV